MDEGRAIDLFEEGIDARRGCCSPDSIFLKSQSELAPEHLCKECSGHGEILLRIE